MNRKKAYVARITFDVSFHSSSDDPLAEFIDNNSDLADTVYEHFGDIEVHEDEMEMSE